MKVTNTGFQLPKQNINQSIKPNSASNFDNIFSAYQAANNVSEKEDAEILFTMNTSHGDKKIDLDKYLTPGIQSDNINLNDIPLLLPTAHNINTLSKYSQEEFKDLLAEYDIPSPPDTIEFDTEGKIVLPNDYPYTTQLKQALSENPKVENALKTTVALASHYAGIMEGQPFRDEMSTARTQADRDRIAEKYSYLFDDNRISKQIILSFLDNGDMLLGQKES
ncbi:hypothetical protein [Colwellia sp. E2M01]|uniref:hypothetical protein n=1 Tax=Colwellia sp. E2M01 TaxID=2841561 RepID=UPI001C08197C|nr:hypothetical protein [Colwellia sp. E2M01]MBU2871002.1 hypothetical protein [Colwellia sp. E2M01]